MDKQRHPHVIRTWTVERTKVLYRLPRPARVSNPRPQAFHNPGKTHPPRSDR